MTDGPAAEVVAALRARALTIASAESLTGGGLGAVITSVPGASEVYVGGVVCYANRVKTDLLRIPASVIDGVGAVSADCARAMATGVRAVVGADLGVATTGVAGPGSQEGKPAGLVYVAVADAAGQSCRELQLTGDRSTIRAATSRAALLLVRERILGSG